MIGKVAPETLTTAVLGKTGAPDGRVLMGPRYGEDTAAIDLGEDILVINSDPLSLAADQVGRLGVHVVCNDIAASGADPAWMTNCMFLHDDDEAVIESVIDQIHRTAQTVDVAIVGGHAEYLPSLDRPLLALTACGRTERYVPSGGADPGDKVILTAGAGIEGTAILATDFREELAQEVTADVLDRAAGFIDGISVIGAARALRDHATGMHDPTEGGVLAGLVEMAIAAGHTFVIDREQLPIRPETQSLCNAMAVDPLRIFGSGAVLATVPAEAADEAVSAVETEGTAAAVIGEVVDGRGEVRMADLVIDHAPRDDLYGLWE